MTQSSNALSAKAKAMYGNRLKEDAYSELCRKQSVSDIVLYLKNSPGYQDILKEVNPKGLHRRQLELILDQDYYERCAKLLRYAPRNQRDFFVHEIMFVEIEVIIDKIMHLRSKQYEPFFLQVPDYLARMMHFDVYGLIAIETFKELQEYLKDTKYHKILSEIQFTETLDFNAIEKAFMEMYYDSYIDTVKKNFKGTLQKELLDILLTSIELRNITKIYRFKKFFTVTPEEIENAIFMKYTRMSKVMLRQLVEAKDDVTFMKLLTASRYQHYVSDDTFTYIEYYAEHIKYNIAKRYMRFSSDAALVYITYTILQQIEIDNLKHIIEGSRYHKSPESIEEMLIYV